MAVAVHEVIRFVSSTSVAPKIAIRWPCTVARYGVNAWAAFAPMPTIGKCAAFATASPCASPGRPQSSPWLFASVTSVTCSALNAVSAAGGAWKTNCFGCGSVQAPEISADSKFVIEMSAPFISVAMSPPSAVRGSSASRTAIGPSKCTSPPNARVTCLPSPRQAGESGEPLGPASFPAALEWLATGGLGAVSPPEVAAPPVPIMFLTIRTAAASRATARAATATWNCFLSRCREDPWEECTTRR